MLRARTLLIAAAALALVPAAAGAVTNLNADVEAQVRAAFADAPDMIAAAKCESGYRQFNDDGSPLHGGWGGKYVGIFQISEEVHSAEAARLGDDISTVAGNIAYARHLYDREGTVPWVSCVPKKVAAAAAAPAPASVSNALSGASSDALTLTLRTGMSDQQVKTLQQTLNAAGYAVAASGPGSSGSETERFGALTRAAVRKFQCDKGIVCQGDEDSTGYGLVGRRTRSALNALLAH